MLFMVRETENRNNFVVPNSTYVWAELHVNFNFVKCRSYLDKAEYVIIKATLGVAEAAGM